MTESQLAQALNEIAQAVSFLAVSGAGVLILRSIVRHGVRDAQNDKGKTHDRTSLQILEERYARGEIDHAEFEERRRRLMSRQ